MLTARSAERNPVRGWALHAEGLATWLRKHHLRKMERFVSAGGGPASDSSARVPFIVFRSLPTWAALRPGRREVLALGAGVLVVAALVTYLALGREHAFYDTETDFLGAFMPEAVRLLEGEALAIEYHPPMYSAVLATVYTLVGDWFAAGLLLSWLSACLTLGLCVALFGFLGGTPAAWGSLVALGSSHVFLAYSAQATSDVFFLGLYCGVILLALYAFLGPERPHRWLILGLLIGVALLSRTNALTLLAFAGTPWLTGTASTRDRAARTGWTVVGVALPVATWAILASLSGSPFAPSGTLDNVVMTYYGGGDRISYENLIAVSGRFDSLWAVLAHDPLHLIAQYARDLFDLPRRILSGSRLLLFPLELFALPGLVLFFFAPGGRFKFLLGVSALLQIALLNLKTFDPRFYLFLVPLMGAGAGLAVVFVLRRCQPWAAVGIALALSVYLAADTVLVVERVRILLGRDEHEIAAAAAAVRDTVPPGSAVVARKPHIPYYAGASPIYLPEAATIEALRDSLIAGGVVPDYLFFGKIERSRRPELEALLEPGEAPGWLEPLTVGEDGGWVLYRVRDLQPDPPEAMSRHRELPEALSHLPDADGAQEVRSELRAEPDPLQRGMPAGGMEVLQEGSTVGRQHRVVPPELGPVASRPRLGGTREVDDPQVFEWRGGVANPPGPDLDVPPVRQGFRTGTHHGIDPVLIAVPE